MYVQDLASTGIHTHAALLVHHVVQACVTLSGVSPDP